MSAPSNGETPTTSHLDPVRSREEEDQQIRSNKKVKNKRLRLDEDGISSNDLDMDIHDETAAANQNQPMATGEDSGSKAPLSFRDVVKNDLPKEVYFDENVVKWASDIAESNMSVTQEFDLNKEVEVVDRMLPNIIFPPELLEDLRSHWKNSLIVKLLGKNIGFNNLCSKVKHLWNLQAGFEVVDLDGVSTYSNSR